MPYTITRYKLGKLETPDKKLVTVRARIEARESKMIIYVDIIERSMLNSKEQETLAADSVEYALIGRIEVSPQGNVTEL